MPPLINGFLKLYLQCTITLSSQPVQTASKCAEVRWACMFRLCFCLFVCFMFIHGNLSISCQVTSKIRNIVHTICQKYQKSLLLTGVYIFLHPYHSIRNLTISFNKPNIIIVKQLYELEFKQLLEI